MYTRAFPSFCTELKQGPSAFLHIGDPMRDSILLIICKTHVKDRNSKDKNNKDINSIKQ